MTYRILTLNNISAQGTRAAAARALRGRPRRSTAPDAILVRSADMHTFSVPPTVLRHRRAPARAPTTSRSQAMSRRGIPVFNAPGANANAVKELVLAGLLLAARNICPGLAVRPQPAGR